MKEFRCGICKLDWSENQFSYFIPGDKVWTLKVCDQCFGDAIRWNNYNGPQKEGQKR